MSDAGTKTKNIIDTERYKYTRTVLQDGRRKVYSKDNADPVAVALRGMTTEDLLGVLQENGMRDKRYDDYAASMGSGRFRMTAGQAIRYRWRRGEETKVKGQVLDAYVKPAA